MSIAMVSSQTNFNIPKFAVGDAKVECTLHPQGLDQDYNDRRVTVTSIIHLPKHVRNADSIYAKPNSTFKVSVYIYDGVEEEERLIGQATTAHRISEEERKSLVVHMTVHNIISQEDIIFHRSHSENATVRVKAELGYKQKS